MRHKQDMVPIRKVNELLETLGPPIVFRKMFGILNALEMQVEDGHYQRSAVARLCEALLACAELYDIPEQAEKRLEVLVREIVIRYGE